MDKNMPWRPRLHEKEHDVRWLFLFAKEIVSLAHDEESSRKRCIVERRESLMEVSARQY